MRRRSDSGAPDELCSLLRCEYSADEVLLTGTGTQALQLAIRAAARRTGEEAPRLALPAFTCFDVGSAGVWSELPLLFFDIDPETLTPDLETYERALRDGARVLVVSPLYGIPVPWEPLAELAGCYGAVLIEDAAQGHGARWRGMALGSLGEISVLSFGRGKGWTGGRGGAVLLRGDSAAEDRRVCEAGLAAVGASAGALLTSAAQWAFGRPRLYAIPASIPWLGLGETRYHEPAAPAAMPRAVAAFALATREASIREAADRRRHGADLARRLTGETMATIPIPDGGEPGYLRFPVRVADGRRTAWALRRMGVAASYPTTLAALDPVRMRLTGEAGAWPGAERLVHELVTLPTHGRVGKGERERMVRALVDASGVAIPPSPPRSEARIPPATARPGYSDGAVHTG